MMLPHVPASKMHEGLHFVVGEMERAGVANLFRHVNQHILSFWFTRIGRDVLDIGDLSLRTNNPVETFYSELKKQLHNRKSPTFYTLLRKRYNNIYIS